MICTECTEGMKATKRKRRRTITTLVAEFFSGIAVNSHRRSKDVFTTWIRTGKEESMTDEPSENMSIDNNGDTDFGSFGKV